MFESFEAAETYYYGQWYSQTPNFEEALRVALWSYENYPQHEKQIMLDLGILYYKVGQTEEATAIFHKALDQGIWYPKEFLSEFWDQAWFQPVMERWMDHRDLDVAACQVTYEFLAPKSLAKDKPIFLALHGWGEDIALFKQFWHSKELEDNYNTIFVQSSQMIGAYHYKWSDYQWAKKDILKVLSTLEKEYGLSLERLYLGGFSEGATTALKLALEEDGLNVKGLVLLNPDKPETLVVDTAKTLKDRGTACGIITGDQDGSYGQQLDMKALFEHVGVAYEWIVTENFGHWFPKDLSDKIDRVLTRFNN